MLPLRALSRSEKNVSLRYFILLHVYIVFLRRAGLCTLYRERSTTSPTRELVVLSSLLVEVVVVASTSSPRIGL